MEQEPAGPTGDDAHLAAFVGPNWETHYRASFQRAALGRRFLVTAEELYYADSSTYTMTPPAFKPSEGVTFTIGVATKTGWNATATHPAMLSVCGVFTGDAPVLVGGSDAREGEPICERR